MSDMLTAEKVMHWCEEYKRANVAAQEALQAKDAARSKLTAHFLEVHQRTNLPRPVLVHGILFRIDPGGELLNILKEPCRLRINKDPASMEGLFQIIRRSQSVRLDVME